METRLMLGADDQLVDQPEILDPTKPLGANYIDVFLSCPSKNPDQVDLMQQMVHVLKEQNVRVYCPAEVYPHAEQMPPTDRSVGQRVHFQMIHHARIVIAVLDWPIREGWEVWVSHAGGGPPADSYFFTDPGVAAHIGYATAMSKSVIGFTETPELVFDPVLIETVVGYIRSMDMLESFVKDFSAKGDWNLTALERFNEKAFRLKMDAEKGWPVHKKPDLEELENA